MSTSSGIEWSRFSQDPRRPEVAAIRASDLDRGVALDAIGEAYADGRLDREEYDARVDVVGAAKTFGDLLTPLRDLTSDHAPAASGQLTEAQIQARAESHYRERRQQALLTILVPNLVVWAIYAWSIFHGGGAFPWPLFVTIGTGMNLVRVLINRDQIVNERVAKLERRQQQRLEKERRGQLGAPASDPEDPEDRG
jgi:Domain of unknown function (DUF1707)